ncbi:MAG TPA: cysteine--tRNA ligase [Candidatus Paceibacterota bacterium]|nr:cysteine--tRNA ligase [Candidatus Paceibacterota bacterium]
MPLKFYNTLTRKIEEFTPIKPGEVKMYSCGPTVYNYAHIGNLRAYVFADILRKTLKYNNLKVTQIMNITDIGHLSSDADSGDDKMTKGLLREGKELNLKNMRELAEFYAEKFKEDITTLNINLPDGMYYASDYVQEDIDLIKKLEEKNFTYKTSDGIYFDTAKMPDYGVLWSGKRVHSEEDSRIAKNAEKKNPEDFALWKFNNQIGFESPFGKGFPGWHIECSAMSMKFLGEQFDIHTGGVDHISIHHTNEIAQSECATGKKPFVKFWLHNEFVDIGGAKMAKSDDNFLKLSSLKEKNFNPIAYRFWLLMANYRTKVNFNWEALEGAETALKRLFRLYMSLGEAIGNINTEYQKKFKEYISDDLDTPKALVLLWDLIKDDNISNPDKKATILDFDKVLGLGFANLKEEKIPEEILKLVAEREEARKNKDFKKSDELRDKIILLGYEIKDTPEGYKIEKI